MLKAENKGDTDSLKKNGCQKSPCTVPLGIYYEFQEKKTLHDSDLYIMFYVFV
jgi:hypothetical protein